VSVRGNGDVRAESQYRDPLFFDPKTAMLFGDAKASIVAVTDELNALGMPAASDTVGAAQASS
jgi:hypothetical protein